MPVFGSMGKHLKGAKRYLGKIERRNNPATKGNVSRHTAIMVEKDEKKLRRITKLRRKKLERGRSGVLVRVEFASDAFRRA